MDICYQYSCRWRYDYNHKKCAVVVFNESVKEYKASTRTWKLGNDTVCEKEKYVHLGILCNKYMDIDENVENCKSKLKGTLFSITNAGIYEKGINPLTSYKLYKSIILPKALYGCELLNNLSVSNISVMERSHRFCLKFIQNINNATRTDVALTLLGGHCIEQDIDYRKMIFFGQLCNLPDKFLAKYIFHERLYSYCNDPNRKRGFIPDIYRLICGKYNLSKYFNDYVTVSVFPTTTMWKGILRKYINAHHLNLVKIRLSEDERMNVYLRYFPDIDNPCCIWVLSKKFPKLLTECQSTIYIQLLSQLFSRDYLKSCNKCGITVQNIPLHSVFHCSHNESIRIKFWREIYIKFGFDIYASLIKLDFTSQITHLCSGLSQTLKCDTKRERCLVLVVKSFHEMYT